MHASLFHETETAAAAIGPLAALLDQLADLLGAATDEQYVRKPVGLVAASMGGHVRHCLDHVETVLKGAWTGVLCYDDRRRGTDVETDRHAALAAIRRLQDDLPALASTPLDVPMRLHVLVGAEGPNLAVETSLGRELAFAISHTIHHNAVVSVIAKTLGLPLPERFGYAPSTIAHAEGRRCAR
jgi:uncharacterized damage-inducible protein DinB